MSEIKKNRLKVFLEGVELPPKGIGVTVNYNAGQPSTCTVMVPPIKEFHNLKANTKVAVFLLDDTKEYKQEDDNTIIEVVGESYRLIFEGVFVGINFDTSVSSKRFLLQCTGLWTIPFTIPMPFIRIWNYDAQDANFMKFLGVQGANETYGAVAKELQKSDFLKFIGVGDGEINTDSFLSSLIKDGIANCLKSIVTEFLTSGRFEYFYKWNSIFKYSNTIYTDGSLFNKELAKSVFTWEIVKKSGTMVQFNQGIGHFLNNLCKRIDCRIIPTSNPSAIFSGENIPPQFSRLCILPDLLGVMPPMCNVIKTDEKSQFAMQYAKIYASRLMVSAPSTDMVWEYVYFPETINKNTEVTDEEWEIGFRPQSMTAESHYGTDLGTFVSESVKKTVPNRMYKLQSAQNTISIMLDFAYPHFTVGFPAIVRHHSGDYYGMLHSATIFVDDDDKKDITKMHFSYIRPLDKVTFNKDIGPFSPWLDVGDMSDEKIKDMYTKFFGKSTQSFGGSSMATMSEYEKGRFPLPINKRDLLTVADYYSFITDGGKIAVKDWIDKKMVPTFKPDNAQYTEGLVYLDKVSQKKIEKKEIKNTRFVDIAIMPNHDTEGETNIYGDAVSSIRGKTIDEIKKQPFVGEYSNIVKNIRNIMLNSVYDGT